MIRVLIVDDQVLIRTAVRQILSGDPEMDVVGEADNGREALRFARELVPDIVVMDLRMPVMGGIEATTAICADERLAGTKVLVLTTFEDDENVFAALRAGASGFIGKGAEPSEILQATRAIHAGESLLSPTATKALITRFLHTAPQTPSPVARRVTEPLTPREEEILRLVAKGNSNDEIARALVISPLTVKTHVSRIMYKLSAHDRAQLVVWAYETRFVSPDQ